MSTLITKLDEKKYVLKTSRDIKILKNCKY